MAYEVVVKGRNKKLAKEQMSKILDMFGDQIDSIAGPYDEPLISKRGYKENLSPAEEKAKIALEKTYESKDRPVSAFEVRETLGLSRNLTSGYLSRLVEKGHAEKVSNTIGVEKANKLFKPKRQKKY